MTTLANNRGTFKDNSTETDLELEKQIKSLQKAFAQERGENNEFREEVRALLRRLSSWRVQG
jgi:hypothetical protein